jgi:hypothetical protein
LNFTYEDFSIRSLGVRENYRVKSV